MTGLSSRHLNTIKSDSLPKKGVLAPRQVAGLSICGGNEYPEHAECAGCPEDTNDHWYLSWPSQPGYSLLRGGNSP